MPGCEFGTHMGYCSNQGDNGANESGTEPTMALHEDQEPPSGRLFGRLQD